MIIGYAEISLRLDGVASLKEKRRILKGQLERLRRSLGVSIAEVGDQDLWGNAVIGVCFVSDNASVAGRQIDRVVEAFETLPAVELDGLQRDWIRV